MSRQACDEFKPTFVCQTNHILALLKLKIYLMTLLGFCSVLGGNLAVWRAGADVSFQQWEFHPTITLQPQKIKNLNYRLKK
jgi:hypothetical protein